MPPRNALPARSVPAGRTVYRVFEENPVTCTLCVVVKVLSSGTTLAVLALIPHNNLVVDGSFVVQLTVIDVLVLVVETVTSVGAVVSTVHENVAPVASTVPQ